MMHNDGFFDRSQLVNALHDNIVEVKFTKVDGTERVMRCTLMQEYLPSGGSGKQLLLESQPTAISVWDVDAKGWRSFRLDNVKSVSY